MRFSSLFDKFSPPKFLDVPYGALVFSDMSIRSLFLDRQSKKPVSWEEVPLEPGVIVSGKIKNPAKLEEAIKKIKESLPVPFVRFTIPDEISYVFTAKVPVFPGHSASEGVAFVIEENVPLPLEDASFDFLPQKVEQTSTGFAASVVATATSSSLVDSYVSAIKNASLEPILCVNESQAMAKAVIPKGKDKKFIISYIHTSSVGTYVSHGQTIEFSSIAEIPKGSNYIQIVVSELSNAAKYLFEHGESGDVECFFCGQHEMCMEAMKDAEKIQGLYPSLANVWANTFPLDKYVPEMSFEDSLKFASAVGLLT